VTGSKNSDRAPHLGIFWLVDGKLIIDSSPLSEAERYGDHMTHPRSHIRVWAKLRRSGRVPRGSEYDEYPRGRVMHDPASGQFTIFCRQVHSQTQGLDRPDQENPPSEKKESEDWHRFAL
jgi:hypothetical protein